VVGSAHHQTNEATAAILTSADGPSVGQLQDGGRYLGPVEFAQTSLTMQHTFSENGGCPYQSGGTVTVGQPWDILPFRLFAHTTGGQLHRTFYGVLGSQQKVTHAQQGCGDGSVQTIPGEWFGVAPARFFAAAADGRIEGAYDADETGEVDQYEWELTPAP
jgi:hypothetical protein